jgi:hypothetical protein
MLHAQADFFKETEAAKFNLSVKGGERLSLRAERSNLMHCQSLDCFVVSLLAMTHDPRLPRVTGRLPALFTAYIGGPHE